MIERQDPRTVRFPCFDGFRAIAALGVLINHVAFFSGYTVRARVLGPFLSRLDMGVAVFFLVSGFLLYRPFVVRIFAEESRPATRTYLKRRALRILPAYWLCLTIVVYVLGLQHLDLEGFVLHYSLLQIYSHAHIIGGPVQQAWTLAVEMTFYLFLPIWAWFTARVTRDARQALRIQIGGVIILYLVSVVYRVLLYTLHAGDVGRFRTWLPGYFDYFALGMGLAVVSAWLANSGRREWSFAASRAFPWLCWGAALATFVIVSTAIGLPRGPVQSTTRDLPGPQEMGLQFFYGLTAFFLLLPGVFGPQRSGVIRRLLTNPVVAWFGVVSYGIYLWHEAALDQYSRWTGTLPFRGSFLPMLLAVLALTLAAAALSYYVVERPILRLKDRPAGGRRARVLAGSS